MNPHEFEITLEFEKQSRDPSRIFYSMGEYIDSFSLLDSSLLSIFDAKIDTHLELEDIKSGSVKALISRVLNTVDDEALKEGDWNRVLGLFLHKAKHSVLQWCEQNKEITDVRLLEEQTQKINLLAGDTNLQFLPAYQEFTPKALLTCVQSLEDSGKILHESDKVIYKSNDDEIEVSRNVSFAPEVIAEVLSPEPENLRQQAIVTIKKPDYLGNSQWELRMDGHTIKAHILDDDWLTSFKKRQFEIMPGDSLRVILEIRYPKDKQNQIKETQYDVVEVLGIVPGTTNEQQDFTE